MNDDSGKSVDENLDVPNGGPDPVSVSAGAECKMTKAVAVFGDDALMMVVPKDGNVEIWDGLDVIR